MRKYKEEYVGRIRLTQPVGSGMVTVHFPRDMFPGRDVKVAAQLAAERARAIVIEAANIAEAEDKQTSALAEVNARRSSD